MKNNIDKVKQKFNNLLNSKPLKIDDKNFVYEDSKEYKHNDEVKKMLKSQKLKLHNNLGL